MKHTRNSGESADNVQVVMDVDKNLKLKNMKYLNTS
jgi:hypothetical protein